MKTSKFLILTSMSLFCSVFSLGQSSTVTATNKIGHSTAIKNAVSTNTSLFTPTSEIVDGGVYEIRNAGNPGYVFDVPNNQPSVGTTIQIYNQNDTGAQRFVIKKQFNYQSVTTYRISPIYSYNTVLRLGEYGENELLKIDNENNSMVDLLSDKF